MKKELNISIGMRYNEIELKGEAILSYIISLTLLTFIFN